MNPQLNKIFSKLAKAEKTELKSEKVELGIIDDINKLKKSIESEYKTHNNKLNSFGANSRKLLNQIDSQKKEGITLEKEADQIRKKVGKLNNDYQKIKKQANSLGLDLPKGLDKIGGIPIDNYDNKLGDTYETINEFLDEVK